MAQFLRPDSDVANTWTGAYTTIDESTASDADFTYSAVNPNGSGAEFGLSNPTNTPASGTCTVRYREVQVNGTTPDAGGTAVSLNVQVLQGTTVIASSGAHTLAIATWRAGSFTFNTSAVSNWNDLRIKFVATGGGGSPANRRGAAVSWAEIETPDGAVSYTLACAGGTVAVTGTAAGLWRGWDSTGKWTPANLSHTKPIWLDAFNERNVTRSGDVVTTWTSEVGSLAPTQATSGFRPTYSNTGFNTSYPAVVFDDANSQRLEFDPTGASFATTTAEGHTFVVATHTNSANTGYPAAFSVGDRTTNADPPTGTRFSAREVSVDPSEQAGYDIWFEGVYTTTSWLNTPRIVQGRTSGTTIYVRVDGGTETSKTDARFDESSPLYGSVGSGCGPTEEGFWDGPVAEVLVVNGSLTTDERERIEGYLAHKWGLASNLPGGHTYKSAAPTTVYTLACAAGSVAVTGTVVALERGYRVPAEAGSVAVTGTAAGLERGFKIAADAGSVAVAGTAAALERGYLLTCDSGSFSVTGTAVALERSYVFAADSGSFAVTGTAATLTYTPAGTNYTLACDSGSFSVAGSVSSAWTPDDLAVQPKIWITAKDAGITLDGSNRVTLWPNKGTGGDFDQPAMDAETNRPTYSATGFDGTRPTVTGDGTNDRLNALVAFTNSGHGSFVAAKWGTGTNDRLISIWGAGSAPTGATDFNRSYTAALIVQASGFRTDRSYSGSETGFNTGSVSTASMSAAETVILGLTFGAANSGVHYKYKNGTQAATTTQDAWKYPFDTTIATILARASAETTAVADAGNHSISEWIALDYEPTTDERQRIEGYLAWEWGKEASLPTGHPYEDAAPTTGAGASLSVTRSISAEAGSVAVTGTDASLERGYRLTAGSGSYNVSGTDAGLLRGILFTADDPGALLLENGAALRKQDNGKLKKEKFRSGDYVLTGTDIDLSVATEAIIAATSGSYSLTGSAANLEHNRVLAAGSGSYAVTGTAASLVYGYQLAVDAGSLVLTGTAASLEYGRLIAAESGGYAVTGTAAALEQGYVLAADSGSVALTGTDAGLEQGYVLAVEAGSYSVTGTAAGLVKTGSYTLAADAGSYAVTGTVAGLIADRTLAADSATYAVTGTAAALEQGYNVAADAGSVAVIGTDVDLVKAGAQNLTLTADAGSFAVIGTAVSLEQGYKVASDAGSFAVTGTDAALERGYTLSAEVGSVSIVGTAAGLTYDQTSYVISADGGSISLAGTAATLRYSGETALPRPGAGGAYLRPLGNYEPPPKPTLHHTMFAEGGSYRVRGKPASFSVTLDTVTIDNDLLLFAAAA